MKSINIGLGGESFYKLLFTLISLFSVVKMLMAQFPTWIYFSGAGALALEKEPTRPDIVVLLSTFISMLYYICVYHSVTNWHTS